MEVAPDTDKGNYMRIRKLCLLLCVMGLVGCSSNGSDQNGPGQNDIIVDYGRILPQEDLTITISLSETLSYSHKIHGSVGYSFNVEYDETAFLVDTHVVYDNPKAVEEELCGGDSAVKTCVFTPRKKGKYTIKIVHKFRGDTTNVITFN